MDTPAWCQQLGSEGPGRPSPKPTASVNLAMSVGGPVCPPLKGQTRVMVLLLHRGSRLIHTTNTETIQAFLKYTTQIPAASTRVLSQYLDNLPHYSDLQDCSFPSPTPLFPKLLGWGGGHISEICSFHSSGLWFKKLGLCSEFPELKLNVIVCVAFRQELFTLLTCKMGILLILQDHLC